MKSNIELAIHQLRTEIKVDSEGKGFCSIRGVARLADVSISSIVESLQSGDRLEHSKMARYLIQQGFEGDRLANFGKTGVPDLAVAAILEYYSFEAERYCTKQASDVYRAFARVGIRAWMQDLAGYQKPQKEQVDLREFIIQQLPEKKLAWDCKFSPEFWIALENLYGLKKGKRACGMFISHWVYGYFPKEVKERLEEINPVTEKGYRQSRHHQHFDDVLLKALKMQISLVTQTMMKSKTRHHFKRLMKQNRRYKFTSENLQRLQG